MTGKVIIGSTDITNLVVDGTYKMDMVEQYTSWQDGNNVTHRSNRISKLKGSFDLVLCDKVGMNIAELYALIEGLKASTGAVLCALYCTNTGSVEAVNAFLHLDSKDHILTTDGFIDVVTIEVEQR